MWTSKKFYTSYKVPSFASEPEQSYTLSCPNCRHGYIEVKKGKGNCLNCGNYEEIENFYTECTIEFSETLHGQMQAVITVLC